MEPSRLDQVCALGFQRAYHRHHHPPHGPALRLPSTRRSVPWESLVGPTASLTPLTIATLLPPLFISLILRMPTIQSAVQRPTLTRLCLISSPSIAPRS